MRFLIIAIDHGWQSVPHGPETPESTADKTRLETVLTQTIADRGVDLICEESDPCRLSVAQKIAYEHNPRIPCVRTGTARSWHLGSPAPSPLTHHRRNLRLLPDSRPPHSRR